MIFALVFLALNVANARADVYVKVDASGNAIGGAIMCDAGTCAAGSLYSESTLQPGEQYVLQGTGFAGIGNNNPNTQVTVDLQTNVWTINSQAQVIMPDTFEPVLIQSVQTFTPETNPWNPAPVIAEPIFINPQDVLMTTLSVQTFNVVMATKSGIKITKKENAKVLIRKKGKK